MKKIEVLDSLEYVDAKIINEADNYVKSKPNIKRNYVKWCTMAACFCFLLAGTFGVSYYNQHRYSNPTETTQDAGLYIPAVELPNKVEGTSLDMIGLVVYNGSIYTQSEDYTGEDAFKIDALIGNYLGYASGSIDEWSTQEEYGQNFASTVAGEVYDVKGYDTDFRICIRNEVKNANGETTLWIQFFDCLNGITLTTGEDLFENRLHIGSRVKDISWQSHEDWDFAEENYHDANLNTDIWEEFFNQINKSKFIYTYNPAASFYQDIPNSSIYDTPNQAHLIMKMEDGTVISLRLIEGGYVGYDALGWYFVQIPQETFDAVYDACGGSRID